MIFQYPIVSLIAAIATDVTQVAGIYCEYVTKPYFAKLYVSDSVHLPLWNPIFPVIIVQTPA